MEQRHDAQHPLHVVAGGEQRLTLAQVDGQGMMTDTGALGPAGGAAGELQGGRVAGFGQVAQRVEIGAVAPYGQTVAAAHGNQVFNLSGAGCKCPDQARQRLVTDYGGYPGIVQHGLQFTLRVNGVQGHRFSARGVDGIHGDTHVDGIAHQQRNPAPAQAELPEFQAEAGHATQVFPVIEPFPAQRQGFPFGAPRGRVRQRVDHGGEGHG